MRTLFVDCVGGASGDMLLGAMADLGATEAIMLAVGQLNLPGCYIRFESVKKNGFAACQALVEVPKQPQHRHIPEIITIIENSKLTPALKEQAGSIVMRLAEAEAEIHGQSVETVHLHELGGDDTLIDIVGFLAGLRSLQTDSVVVSPLPVGRGFVSSAHGPLPLPAPATLALLKGAPLRPMEWEGEFVTPTGALLLSSVATSFASCPQMVLERIGYGAGRKDFPFPNLLRLWLGEACTTKGLVAEQLLLLESNIDDCSPQLMGNALEQLLAGGALDVALVPQQMKKNRPGVLLSVLCRPDAEQTVLKLIFDETPTLGVKRTIVERLSLPRREETIQTQYGPIRVKIAEWNGTERASPEYDDCRRAAKDFEVPLARVFEACSGAIAQWRDKLPQAPAA